MNKNLLLYLLIGGGVYYWLYRRGRKPVVMPALRAPGGIPQVGIPAPQVGQALPGAPVTVAPTPFAGQVPGGPLIEPIPIETQVSGPSIEDIATAPPFIPI